jgi:hypothetical protein
MGSFDAGDTLGCRFFMRMGTWFSGFLHGVLAASRFELRPIAKSGSLVMMQGYVVLPLRQK